MEEWQPIEPILKGSASNIELNPSELNTAATLASLSVKLMDAMANIYQIHSNMVRLGQNLDIMFTSLNNYSKDFNSKIQELQMRVSDLEAFKVSEFSDNGDNHE